MKNDDQGGELMKVTIEIPDELIPIMEKYEKDPEQFVHQRVIVPLESELRAELKDQMIRKVEQEVSGMDCSKVAKQLKKPKAEKEAV